MDMKVKTHHHPPQMTNVAKQIRDHSQWPTRTPSALMVYNVASPTWWHEGIAMPASSLTLIDGLRSDQVTLAGQTARAVSYLFVDI